MTFSIDVKELPERCFYSPYSSKLDDCYPAYEYNLKTTKVFRFIEHIKNLYSTDKINELDNFEIENKYNKLLISKSLYDDCSILINKIDSALYCKDSYFTHSLLIKCEPSKVLIVENNKGSSSAVVDYNELLPLIELGFYQSVPLVCIVWSDIEHLFIALHATISEGNGSRVRIILNGVYAVFHRPHPRKETDRGAVKSVRRFLIEAGVKDVKI